jgi:hypothetical protein
MSEIIKLLQPGDVINQIGHPKWYQFWLHITYAAIRWHQKRLFERANGFWQPPIRYQDTHTMMYFDEERTFSVELPKATFVPLEEWCQSDFSVYRLNYHDLSTADIEVMEYQAHKMFGEAYDIGQLLDIAINGILGYDHLRKLSLFDYGAKNKVCSVGVRVLFEKLNQERKISSGKWLFHSLKTHVWSPKQRKEYTGTDVEATTPAHFANSYYFGDEFGLVARFKNGKPW